MQAAEMKMTDFFFLKFYYLTFYAYFSDFEQDYRNDVSDEQIYEAVQ